MTKTAQWILWPCSGIYTLSPKSLGAATSDHVIHWGLHVGNHEPVSADICSRRRCCSSTGFSETLALRKAGGSREVIETSLSVDVKFLAVITLYVRIFENLYRMNCVCNGLVCTAS
jgi:hypothetical protein